MLSITAALLAVVFSLQGAPTGGSALLIAGLAGCLAEALGVRLPHSGTVSFGLVVYAPLIVIDKFGASSALAVAIAALSLRELLTFSSPERLADEMLLELFPLSAACLVPLLLGPNDPQWMLGLAVGLSFVTVRQLEIRWRRARLTGPEADLVQRLQEATADIRWGVLGLSLVAIPLLRQGSWMLLAMLPAIYSLRKAAIHAYAYLDKEDKKALRKTLKGAETQIVELAATLETTEAQRNLLFDLSKDTARCTSLSELLVIVEKKTQSLKLGHGVQLLLQEPTGWLYLSVDKEGRPRCESTTPTALDSGFAECWNNGSALFEGRARGFYPLPGIGVLSLQASPAVQKNTELRQVMSLFCSQVSLACLSAHRIEVLGKTMDQLANLNKDLEIGNESLRVAMDKLRASEAKLIEAAKLAAVGQLSAGLAHEINNPLGSIRLGIETTLRKETLTPLSTDLLQRSLKAVKRAETIIGSLLSYSRAGSKGKVPTSAWDVLFDSCAFLRGSLRLQGINLALPERGEEVRLLVNPQEMQQILANLLLNAKDAVEGHNPSQITIVAGPHPAGAFIIEVHDSGEGVPPELRDKIFDPFFTTKPVGKGTGLGLSVSREMAAAQGGRLEGGSSSLLSGACFRLSLPVMTS